MLIPKDSIFRPTTNLFTGTFNNPLLGGYDFKIAANTLQTVLPMTKSNLYLISIINFSATCPESAFLENISTIPQLRFYTKQNKKPLYGGQYPLARYLVNNEVGTFFESPQSDDTLLASFEGTLNQSASLIPFASITVVVALNIWEITDRAFINAYHKIKTLDQGKTTITIPSQFESRV